MFWERHQKGGDLPLISEYRLPFVMNLLDSLLPLEEFTLRRVAGRPFGKSKKEMDITSDDFADARSMVDCLRHTIEAMTSLQGEQLLMGDFLRIWMLCKSQISKLVLANCYGG